MQIENIHYCKQSLQEENIMIRAKSRQNIDKTLIIQFHDLRTIEIFMNRDEMNANDQHNEIFINATKSRHKH